MPGALFYEGPSRLGGDPIVGIITWGSKNPKTGPLAQTWILSRDIHPIEAVRDGSDAAICGSCPLRGLIDEGRNKARGCYVKLHQAPRGIWDAYQRGVYPRLTRDMAKILAGLGLRYGAYGDPVAIPRRHWALPRLLCTGRSAPGYTHQWRDRRFAPWRTVLMASTHSEAENRLAHSLGWRTFRTVRSVDELARNEIICPASEEAGKRATCEQCGACDGRRSMSDTRRNIAIVSHGFGRRSVDAVVEGRS